MRGTLEITWDIVNAPEVEWNALKDADPYEDQELGLPGPARPSSHERLVDVRPRLAVYGLRRYPVAHVWLSG